MQTSAQDKTTEELKALAKANQYDKIIREHAAKSSGYSAIALYYIGLSYYMKEDDRNCLRFMDSSIAKDPAYPASHYIKAQTLNYLGKFNEAIPVFNTAIKLKPDDAEFYSGLGDAYYNLEKKELALEQYKKATEQEKCPERPYAMIAQIYAHRKEDDKALEAFYLSKSKASKTSGTYLNALYNIGIFESQKGNYDKAESVYTELISLSPNDYQSYAKLIQVYYQKKEDQRATPYRDKLYEAHKKGLLKDNLKDKFCFDQFKWNGYTVQVYERFENENKGKIYYKHIFYLINNAGKTVLTAQTEFSPTSVEMNGPKYLLCVSEKGNHYNPAIGVDDGFKYEDLKANVIALFKKYAE
jgi:tetratricopeptide (TPR) repeat protein